MSKTKAPKLPKGVDETFVDSIASMDRDQLKETIVGLQVYTQEVEASKEAPEFVAAQAEFDLAKERHSLVTGPVKDTLVSLKNKTKLAVDRLNEKGGA